MENCLSTIGVFYDFISCSGCGIIVYRNENRGTFRCTAKNCRTEVSQRKHTVFFGSHLNCAEIMHIAYMWLNNCGRNQIAAQTGHSSATITKFMSYFRNLVSSTLEYEDEKIGGDGVIVEIDETKLGKRKYNKGHHVEGVWVLVGVERSVERKVFMCELENRKKETLIPLIERFVLPGSIVHTDCFKSYEKISTELGLVHGTVNHKLGYKDKITGVHTNTVEGTNNALKMAIKPRNRSKGCGEYLAEFIWRRKMQTIYGKAF